MIKIRTENNDNGEKKIPIEKNQLTQKLVLWEQ